MPVKPSFFRATLLSRGYKGQEKTERILFFHFHIMFKFEFTLKL